jgi:hypothetical protein
MPLVVVSGALANKPENGGAAWTRLSWVLGFKLLGWDVFFLEQIAPEACVDASGAPSSFETSANSAFFRHATRRFGLESSAALVFHHGERILGASYFDLVRLARSADLLVNITGHLTLEPLFGYFKRKIYVDLDPGFTQIWYADRTDSIRLDGYNAFFTVGENIGTAECSIPTSGVPWRPISQPVLLDEWPVAVGPGAPGHFTTVASWRGPYGPVDYQGDRLGLKVHEFRRFIDLPRMAPGTFELALDIHPAEEKDLALLDERGWRVVDPKVVASTPDLFRRYVQTSGAECSVAQGVYVHTRSGWFSDRTVRYLASGKPALVQDTGFSHRYPADLGLVAFSTLEEAAAGAEHIVRHYASHCQAARSIAEKYFAAEKVLGGLLAEVGLAS